jgi:hypothetical protein
MNFILLGRHTTQRTSDSWILSTAFPFLDALCIRIHIITLKWPVSLFMRKCLHFETKCLFKTGYHLGLAWLVLHEGWRAIKAAPTLRHMVLLWRLKNLGIPLSETGLHQPIVLALGHQQALRSWWASMCRLCWLQVSCLYLKCVITDYVDIEIIMIALTLHFLHIISIRGFSLLLCTCNSGALKSRLLTCQNLRLLVIILRNPRLCLDVLFWYQ